MPDLSQAKYPYPSESNPLLFETATYVEAAGLNDPFKKIYITTKPLDSFQAVVFLYVISQLPKFAYDPNTGTWPKRRSKPTAHMHKPNQRTSLVGLVF